MAMACATVGYSRGEHGEGKYNGCNSIFKHGVSFLVNLCVVFRSKRGSMPLLKPTVDRFYAAMHVKCGQVSIL